MGDRTFTADDVLRIYLDYLDEREMKTVEDFFAVETIEVDVSFLNGVLRRLSLLAPILASTAFSAAAGLLGPLTTIVLNEANRGLRDSTSALRGLLSAQGVLDA